MIKTIFSAGLRFYQKFLTLLGFGCCRYYPTCSEYAKWQLETNPDLFAALRASFFRILRCNQLFEGGIDYPVVSRPKTTGVRCDGKPRTIRYWYIPDGRGCRIVKQTFPVKGSKC